MLRTCTPTHLRRTAAFAFALMLGGAALPAQAVSVNDMVVWSASSKPLRMDIALVDLQGVNLRNVSLSVASAAEHARVGLTRPEWADSVSFKIIPVNSGMAVARATSSQAIDGDFVTFLVSIRGGGVAQLQQVASKVSASGAEPLISAQAESVPARVEQVAEPAPTAFADKPVAIKPVVSKPVVSKPVAKVQPKPAPKPVAVEVGEAPAPVAKAAVAPAPAPAPVPPAATPAPAELVAAAEADNSEVLADVGAEPTLDSLQAERIQLLQQVTDIQTRVTELDQQIAALSPESVPASETPTALAEAETSPAEPLEPKALGYTYFSNILLGLLAVFMAGMALLDRVRSNKR